MAGVTVYTLSGHGADLVASRREIPHPLKLDDALTFLVKHSRFYRYVVVQTHIPRITPVDGPEVLVPFMVDDEHILLFSLSLGTPVLTPVRTLADYLSYEDNEPGACRVYVRESSRKWVSDVTITNLSSTDRFDYVNDILTFPWIHPEWHRPQYGTRFPD